MRVSFTKYPIDIILCVLCSLVLLPLILLDVKVVIRFVLGLPFLIFIPGYLLTLAIFPTKKSDQGLGIMERIALSFALSIAVVPLIGLGLTFTPWGIQLKTIYLSIFTFIISVAAIAVIRLVKTESSERFTINFDLSKTKKEEKLNPKLLIILLISILLAVASFAYVIITPKTLEQFTEFYVLGPEGKLINYPINLKKQENKTITIGLANHEYETIGYTIEIWLINQTTNKQEIKINNMWFMNKIQITLDPTSPDTEKTWMPQWEQNYSFNINKTGAFKLAFLLFITPTQEYKYGIDYNDGAENIIGSSYLEPLYLNVNVSQASV